MLHSTITAKGALRTVSHALILSSIRSVLMIDGSDLVVMRLLNRLAPKVNFRAIHLDVRRKSSAGTGAWFLTSRLYCEWKASDGGVLWGMGMPGTGKTVLTSNILHDLLLLENEKTSVILVYCRYSEPLSAREILEAIIKQYLERHPFLHAVISSLYAQHDLEKTEPSDEELVSLIGEIETFFEKCYYGLDGVDEAKDDTQFDLIKAINRLQGNFILTSRPLDHLGAALKYAVFFTISAQREDIELLIMERLDRNIGLRELLDRHGYRQETIRQIVDKAAGMFLHAALQIEALHRCPTIKSLKSSLQQFPAKIEDMYLETLKRIKAQPSEHVTLAQRILLWVIFSEGPLSLKDLQYALSTCPETHQFDEDGWVHESTILSVCCGLIEVDHASNCVRLIHFTAKECLSRFVLESYPHPHEHIAMVLVNRLISVNMHESRRLEKPEDFEDLLSQSPLLRTAHRDWGSHVLKCEGSPTIRAFVLDFLRRCTSFVWDRQFDSLEFLNPLHVIARYGLASFLPDVLVTDEAVWDINSKTTGAVATTALPIAVEYNHEEVVESLLQLDGVQVNVAGTKGWTPLMWAVHKGNTKIVRQLLQHPGIQVNLAGKQGRTVLLEAASNGDEPMVDLLLEAYDIQVNVLDAKGWSPLSKAAGNGHETTVRRLLRVPGIDINLASKRGVTALMEASLNGHICIVKLLLQAQGILANLADSNGWTALMMASNNGHEEIVRLLLQTNGVDVNLAGNGGRTALMKAASKGYHSIVQLLLQAPGIQVDAIDSQKRTALMKASSKGHASIVQSLLKAQGVQANLIDRNGWTALIDAASKGYEDVVRQLLQVEGINVNHADKKKRTALMEAASNGHEGVVLQLLLAEGIRVDLVDVAGSTALMKASSKGHEAIARHLRAF
ncbi:ankyrin repeat domain-containing protein 52 [Coprinopsis cinerea okayama7|uniref:Ankyrin repeat domain-containing protein 52 n=1 Tax=Coprinopsis cinerea (strain Okayama-7 / 130 / ATCC MYA-4618 / FGSC 9003) TaxID=240176 RepID=A8P7G1_COPC7|nr:ankyrin repeat domain-containing protein 52 [Coprinopsis cinerea okayama7\|eukprot:XP_001839352.2 ankyrin repeat domain-containing protein 52 [Coprinopsis cinerea okayama7\